MTFRLVHISDLHLGPLPPVRKRELLSKRITGYANWKRNRAHHLGDHTLGRIMTAISATNADHLAITGDLVNIGLDKEIDNAGKWLAECGPGDQLSVVPGNHDAYVRGTLEKALSRWSDYVRGDDGRPIRSNADFPFLRIRGPVALIGVNSAVATLPFLASGRLKSAQARRLENILEMTGLEGLFRVIMIHHPPVRGAAIPSKRLYGISRFAKAVSRCGAELVLHGHTHKPQYHLIKNMQGLPALPIIGVPSASQAPGGKRPPAAYNLFEIGRKPSGDWSCTFQSHAIRTPGGNPEPVTNRVLY